MRLHARVDRRRRRRRRRALAPLHASARGRSASIDRVKDNAFHLEDDYGVAHAHEFFHARGIPVGEADTSVARSAANCLGIIRAMRDLLHRCDSVRRHSYSSTTSSYAWRFLAVVSSAVRFRLRCMDRFHAAGIFAYVDATSRSSGN